MKMNSRNLVGKCGLYCGACTIYRAYQDSEEWQQEIASRANCSPGQVRCNGCSDLTSECWGNDCKIVSCTRAKGYDFCFECPEFQNVGCQKFNTLSDRYLQGGVNLRDNLNTIKEGKVNEWLQESADKFSCKLCGKPISVWSNECHHCGYKLK